MPEYWRCDNKLYWCVIIIHEVIDCTVKTIRNTFRISESQYCVGSVSSTHQKYREIEAHHFFCVFHRGNFSIVLYCKHFSNNIATLIPQVYNVYKNGNLKINTVQKKIPVTSWIQFEMCKFYGNLNNQSTWFSLQMCCLCITNGRSDQCIAQQSNTNWNISNEKLTHQHTK